MKKGCLIASLLLLALIIAGLGGGAWFVIQKVGLTQAPAVSYERLLEPDTRIVAVLDTKPLASLYTRYGLPMLDKVEAPALLKNRIRSFAENLLPGQVALFGKTDPQGGAYAFRLFINERYLGPLIAAATSNPQSMPAQAQFKYNGPPFALPERGVLTTEKSWPLLDGLASVINKQWPEAPVSPVRPEGGHLLEAVLDNRTGDVLQLLGARAVARGLTAADFFRTPEQESAIPTLLALASEGRLTVDLSPDDAIEAKVFLNHTDPAGAPLRVTAAARLAGTFLDTVLEQVTTTRSVDGNAVLEQALSAFDQFTCDAMFDNGSGQFLQIMDRLGVIAMLEQQGTNVRQQLEIFNKMTQSRLTGVMMDNGDLVIEWRVDSAPGYEGSVYIALGFMPIDQTVLPVLTDQLRQRGMKFTATPASMEQGAAYFRRFTISGFRQNLPALFQPIPSDEQL